MIKMNMICVVIPAYNEESAIGSVVHGLAQRLPNAEIIVVNDGSTDNTAAIAEKAGAVVLSHDHQRGYGASIKTGMQAASGDYIISCDGDGQHSPEDVMLLVKECDGYDMVIGERNSDSYAPVPLLRVPGKLIMEWFANYLTGQKIPDVNSGLRIFKKDTLMRYMHLLPDGFSFSTTSTFAMLKTNKRIKYVPIKIGKRKGKSTVCQWKHGTEALLLMLRLTVLFDPLKVFLNVSGVLFLLTILSLVINLASMQSTGIGDSTVILFISTLIIFMFGLLCDQVSAMRREKHE